MTAPRLSRRGVHLGNRVVPLRCGSVHYYAMPRADWRPALEALKKMGLSFVDTYVPWGVHEVGPGCYDFGKSNANLALEDFLRLASELKLLVLARPGPHVNGELTRFGLPEHVVWDEAVMARSSRDEQVVLPAPPLAFPVPSYASRAFTRQVASWYEAVLPLLAAHSYPQGPVVMLQVDNEAAMYFRDSLFDQDYHPDAVAQFREQMGRRYQTDDELQAAYENPGLSLRTIEPPTTLHPSQIGSVRAALDWAECQEHLVAGAIESFSQLIKNYLPNCLLTHNLPPGGELSVLNPGLLTAPLDLVGADLYHRASLNQRQVLFERVSELRWRADLAETPTFAAELCAGAPPYFGVLDDASCRFTALAALAYGVNAFNVYMAVDRDRWVGAAATGQGELRPLGEFFAQLSEICDRLQFARLSRDIEVRLVVPRLLRRLARILNVAGPLSTTALGAVGKGPLTYIDERELAALGTGVQDAFLYLRAFSEALEAAGVPFEFAQDDQLERTVEASRWTILVCSGALSSANRCALERATRIGHVVSVGPHWPSHDDGLAVATTPGPPDPLESTDLVQHAEIGTALRRRIQELHLKVLSCDPSAHATLFFDEKKAPRVLFVINANSAAKSPRIGLPHAGIARDVLSGSEYAVKNDELGLSIEGKSVRVLELLGDS